MREQLVTNACKEAVSCRSSFYMFLSEYRGGKVTCQCCTEFAPLQQETIRQSGEHLCVILCIPIIDESWVGGMS